MHLDNRGWLQTDLVRSAILRGYRLDSGHLSRILSREQEAGVEAVIAIAEGFHVPREEAFRARGWLPGEPSEVVEADVSQMQYLFSELKRLPLGVRQRVFTSVVAVLDAVQEARADKETSATDDREEALGHQHSENQWVTVADAARQTGYAERTIQKWLQEGKIVGDKPQHEWRTTIESIMAYKQQVKRGRPKKS